MRVAAAAALGAAAVVLVAYGLSPALLTLAVLAPPGVLAALLAERLARRPAPLAELRGRFALLALGTGLIVLAAIGALTAAMFLSAHDALFALIVVGYGAVLALWAGSRVVEAMVARLEGEERMRRMLFAAVSHDLRTPLTALRLLAEAIGDDLGEPREYARRMSTHVGALSVLVDDLFELTRLQSGELRWSAEQVELGALVRETVDALRPVAGPRTVTIEADAAPPVAGSPERLQRVLYNLVQNAIHHTPEDGSVSVRAQRAHGGVEVEVADTGPGIAVEHREQVFEPFFRADPARSAHGGSGLGLAIAQEIVVAHGGRIWVEGAEIGTRVRFFLPLGSVGA